MDRIRPFRIEIEWTEKEDFLFSCHYREAVSSALPGVPDGVEKRFFPVMARAMGNVLHKLRREHISFPLFLVTLAFEHRHLLSEIDQLLHALHCHLQEQKCPGSWSCYVSGERMNPSSSSRG
ncbi:MAG: hypothetical protein K9I59_07155 [Chlorobium sp.]|uniref:hypothetical protein n=1 Tax=Chlorobium sp. TaxID=1095 RepID=UPI001D42B051|nr:hypothetical protein [Chlorobium sp.]MBN1279832.1 hypothetical protein [Chlorobiaceae bacterium]MCF8216544.1 hypothetical protein [Chlorobium sp.]MCF8271449.1 hypothetical protein [Chlorobium sp.]MCF8287821.1 hypothetical protein [Chlorobium sp.]MCF8291360.1 hypothetical protein [Chlorobium sp.]